MPLDFQKLPIPLLGIDTKTDEKAVGLGMMPELINGTFRSSNEIRKRLGFDPLTTDIEGGGSISSAIGIFNYNDELLLVDADGALYSYGESVQKWVNKGAVSNLDLGLEQISRGSSVQSSADSARSRNIEAFAWNDSRGGVRLTVVDTKTGTHYQDEVEVSATGTNPRVLVAKRDILLVYVDGNDLNVRIVDVDSPSALGSETTLRSDVHASAIYDADTSSSLNQGEALVVYRTTTPDIRALYLRDDGSIGGAANGGLPGTTVLTTEDPDTTIGLAVNQTTGNFQVAWMTTASGGEAQVRGFDSDFTALFATATLQSTFPAADQGTRIAGVYRTSTAARWYWEFQEEIVLNNDVSRGVGSQTVTDGGSVAAEDWGAPGVIGHKPLLQGSSVYIGIQRVSTLQSTYFLIDEGGQLVGKSQPNQAGGNNTDTMVPSISQIDTDNWAWASLSKTKIVTEDNVTFTNSGVSRSTYEFGLTKISAVVFNGNLVISGGVVKSYDSVAATELGFNNFPEAGNLAGSDPTALGTFTVGEYQLFAVYKYTDAMGRIHRSSPSVIPEITTGDLTVTVTNADDEIDFFVENLRFTEKGIANDTEPVIEVYCTRGGGTIPFLAKTIAITKMDPTDPRSTPHRIEGTISIEPVGNEEILYTTGGVIENIAPPSANLLAVGKDRLLLSGMEDPDIVWFTKKSDTVNGPQTSDLLTQRTDPFGGPVSALGILDNHVIAFKQDRTYGFSGDGPDNLGNGGFNDINLITADVGCNAPNSVVQSNNGLMFKSDKGIYQINRGLAASYVGDAVEAFNGDSVTGAVLREDNNEIRFSTLGDRMPLYDYYVGRWSTLDVPASIGTTIWKGNQVLAEADGTIHVETPGEFDDNSSYVPLIMETAWIKGSGFVGFQRVKGFGFLGNFLSSHTLVVKAYYDYQDWPSAIYTWDPESVIQSGTYGDAVTYGDLSFYGGSSQAADGVNEFRIEHLNRQKCEAIKFRIEDVGGTGEGYSVVALTAVIGLRPGLNKASSEKTIGAGS